jgi:hypothetical protein
MKKTSKRVVALISATVAVACLAVGGVALAGGSGGTIDACAKKNNGQLRLVGTEACGPSESAVSWNVAGQQGPQGIPGPQGPKGETGQQGPAGADADITPHEGTRILTLPAGPYNGIYGGLQCGHGVLVSGGFSILMPNVEVKESFVGPAFGVDRVYFVRVMSKDGGVLPAGDVVKMYITCLGSGSSAAPTTIAKSADDMTGYVSAAS